MTAIELFISNYGYIALIIGNLIEGETFLILGGLFASSHVLNIYLVILTAFGTTFVIDQIMFHLGRLFGKRIIKNFHFINKKISKINGFIQKNENKLIIGFRFVYGTRLIVPFTLGSNNINPKKFLILELFTVTIWTLIYCIFGYLLGGTLRSLIGDIKEIQIQLSIAIIAIFVIIGLGRYLQNKGNFKYQIFGGKKI